MISLVFRPIPATDRVAGLFGMVHDHWYRSGEAEWYRSDDGGPCAYRDCRRPGGEHFRWVGEWAMPRRERWKTMARRVWNNVRPHLGGEAR